MVDFFLHKTIHINVQQLNFSFKVAKIEYILLDYILTDKRSVFDFRVTQRMDAHTHSGTCHQLNIPKIVVFSIKLRM